MQCRSQLPLKDLLGTTERKQLGQPLELSFCLQTVPTLQTGLSSADPYPVSLKREIPPQEEVKKAICERQNSDVNADS